MKPEKSILIVLSFFLLAITGCRKEDKENDEPTVDTKIASDFSTAEYEANEMFNVGLDAVNYSTEDPDGKRSSVSFYINGCVNATVTPAWPDTSFPKIIELDFGSGCTGADGRVRSGILTVEATGRYRQSGSTYTVTPSNYFVDGNQIIGTKSVSNTGFNAANHLVFDVAINSTVVKPNGDSISYNSNREREWINGYSTNIFNSGVGAYLDDKYSVTGTASGVTAAGTNFNSIIINPLIVDLSCPHITEGTLEIAPQSAAVRTIDWGNGNCDNLIEFSVGNYTVTVTL